MGSRWYCAENVTVVSLFSLVVAVAVVVVAVQWEMFCDLKFLYGNRSPCTLAAPKCFLPFEIIHDQAIEKYANRSTNRSTTHPSTP
jgi:hypothetical protein